MHVCTNAGSTDDYVLHANDIVPLYTVVFIFTAMLPSSDSTWYCGHFIPPVAGVTVKRRYDNNTTEGFRLV